MASRATHKFNRIKSQEERGKALIPAPVLQPSKADVTPIMGSADVSATYSYDMDFSSMRDVQLQLAQWSSARAEATRSAWSFDSSSLLVSGSTYSTKLVERPFPCHEKMKDKDRPYAAELKPHWERAKKLGLTNQAEAIERMALKRDIEELTKGAGYPEVSDSDLEAMFEFPRLRRKVRWHNFKARMAKFFLNDGEGAIVLRLKKDSVERSGVAIPFGAQLRLEEAKEKGIFDSFQVVYPNVVTEVQLAAERARERDPALVGIYQGAMFLICSWDLPLDVRKAETDMDALKALKIEG